MEGECPHIITKEDCDRDPDPGRIRLQDGIQRGWTILPQKCPPRLQGDPLMVELALHALPQTGVGVGEEWRQEEATGGPDPQRRVAR